MMTTHLTSRAPAILTAILSTALTTVAAASTANDPTPLDGATLGSSTPSIGVDGPSRRVLHRTIQIEGQSLLDRPGNTEIQLAVFLDYGSNPPPYPEWQAYLRAHRPPSLITWGKNDVIFPAEGAQPYKRDLKDLKFHLLDTGHFALEEDGDQIAGLIRSFLGRKVGS